MLSEICHVCGIKTTNQPKNPTTLHLKTSMTEENLLPDWFTVKWGEVWYFRKAWAERHKSLWVKGITMQLSEYWAQPLTWLALSKSRTRAVTGCWNHVLSPFPPSQHHLKWDPKLKMCTQHCAHQLQWTKLAENTSSIFKSLFRSPRQPVPWQPSL